MSPFHAHAMPCQLASFASSCFVGSGPTPHCRPSPPRGREGAPQGIQAPSSPSSHGNCQRSMIRFFVREGASMTTDGGSDCHGCWRVPLPLSHAMPAPSLAGLPLVTHVFHISMPPPTRSSLFLALGVVDRTYFVQVVCSPDWYCTYGAASILSILSKLIIPVGNQDATPPNGQVQVQVQVQAQLTAWSSACLLSAIFRPYQT